VKVKQGKSVIHLFSKIPQRIITSMKRSRRERRENRERKRERERERERERSVYLQK